METQQFAENLFTILKNGPKPDNPQYDQVLQSYNQLQSNHNQFISLHLCILSNCSNVQLRKFVITLVAREIMSKPYSQSNNPNKGPEQNSQEPLSLFCQLSNELRNNFVTSIFMFANQENEEIVLRSYVTIIGKIHYVYMDNHIDTGFILNETLKWIHSGNDEHREMGFSILNENIIYDQDKNTFDACLNQYAAIIQFGLQKNDAGWYKNVLCLYVTILNALGMKDGREVQLLLLYPTFLNQFKLIIQQNAALNANSQTPNNGEIMITKAMKDKTPTELSNDLLFDCVVKFDDLVSGNNFLEDSLVGQTIEIFVHLCLSQHTTESVRSVALEVLVSITDSYRDLVKNQIIYLQTILNVVVFWMSTVQLTNTWLEGKDDEDELVYYSSACDAIVQIRENVGTNCILSYILMIQEKLLQGQWQERHVFIQCISKILLGSQKKLLDKFDIIMNATLRFINDDSPRNRLTSLIALNKLVKLSNKKSKNFMPQIVEFALKRMADNVPRIIARSCDLLSFLLDHFEPSVMNPYYEQLLLSLLTLMQSNQPNIVCESACAISFIALKATDKFIPHYQQTIQILASLLEQIGLNEKLFEVKGRIIECLSVIGMKLEGEYCIQCGSIILNDVNKILQLPNLSIENTLFGFVETSFTRIAQIMKENFVQYLPVVLQIVTQRCQMKTIFTKEEVQQLGFQRDDLDKVPENALSIHTALAEEKKNAITAIGDFANDLNEIFSPFVQQCLNVVLPLIQYEYDETIREAATKTTYRLLKSYYIGILKDVKNETLACQQMISIFENIISIICTQLTVERFVETISTLMGYLDCIIDLLVENSLSQNSMNIIMQTMQTLFTDSITRLQREEEKFFKIEKRIEKIKKDDRDDDDDENISLIHENRKIELTFRVQFRRLLSTLSQKHPNTITIAFPQTLYPQITAQMNRTDCIEHVKNYIDYFCETLLTSFAIDTNNPDLIASLTQGFIQKFLQRNKKSHLINLSMLIQYPAAKPFIPTVMNLCQPLFRMKEIHQDLYDAGIMLYGYCLVENGIQNQQICVNYLNTLPNDTYVDETISTVFGMITKQMLTVDRHIMKKIIDLLILIVKYGQIDEFRAMTKDLIKEYLNRWYQQYQVDFTQILNSMHYQDKISLQELWGVKLV